MIAKADSSAASLKDQARTQTGLSTTVSTAEAKATARRLDPDAMIEEPRPAR
jgi:hypothetical protein